MSALVQDLMINLPNPFCRKNETFINWVNFIPGPFYELLNNFRFTEGSHV